MSDRDRGVLVAGWFSLPFGSPTAGDEMCLAVVQRWLDDAGIPHRVLRDVPIERWEALSREPWRAQLWVCGPVSRRFEYQVDAMRRFPGPWILVDATLPDAVDDYEQVGWDITLARDGHGASRPDLAMAYPATQPGGAAVLLRGHQHEYGEDRCLCHVAEPLVRDALARAGLRSFDATTIVHHDAAMYAALLERALLTADIVVTTRLHGVIHGVRTGRPVVALDQVRGGGKVSAQCEALGLPPALRVEDLRPEELDAAIAAALQAPPVFDAERVARSVDDARDLLLTRLEELPPATRSGEPAAGAAGLAPTLDMVPRMECVPIAAACVVGRLARGLGLPSIGVSGDVARRVADELPAGSPVLDARGAGPGAILLCDADADPPAAARTASAVVLVTDSSTRPALDAWRDLDLDVAWHGRTTRGPFAVAVLHPAGESRVASLLSGGPHGLLLDPALDVLDASTDLAGTRVAIVSFELVGLTRTGGIGTAYTALAHALAKAGAHVDALFTGWLSPGVDVDAAIAEYAAAGVHVQMLDAAAADAAAVSPSEHARRGEAVLQWLLERHAAAPYDVVHMPECAGHGAAIAAAKRSGIAFGEATIVTGTHGSSRWVREINGQPFSAPDQLTIDALERRSVEDADVVVSPSAYLVGDMVQRGWRLPDRTFVQQYVLPPAAQEPAPPASGAVRELVFFGRLEARKGLLLFLDALDRLAERVDGDRLTVTFLGRPDVIHGRRADEVIAERRAAWPWPVQMLTALDQPEALAHLRGPQRLAVMPSLADNLPLTVLEGLALGIPFVTCATGGIPEMIDAADLERCASVPEPDALAALLEHALGAEPRVPRFAVDVAANRDAHLRWHAAAAAASLVVQDAPTEDEPLVVTLGEAPELLVDGDAYVLLRSPRHRLDDGAAARLSAAARAAGADIATFSVRTGDGRVAVPIGGPPALAVVTPVMSTGSALVRRSVINAVPADERELDAVLAAAVLAGRRLVVVPLEAAEERPSGPDGEAPAPPSGELAAWWPNSAQIERADAARRRLSGVAPELLGDLPAVATLAAERLDAALAQLAAAEDTAERMSAHWKDVRDTLERRDRELADTIEWANRVEDELAVERQRLQTLRNRRIVRVALGLAAIRKRLARR